MSKFDTSKIAEKIDTSRIADKIAVRIVRKWRNFDAGTIIRPPGAVRQILLEAKDQAGKPVAEIVDEVKPAAPADEIDEAGLFAAKPRRDRKK